MITGINKVFEHDGKELHIQAEDLGLAEKAFELRVYHAGTVMWLKRFGYENLLDENLPKKDQEQALRRDMEKKIFTVEAAIAKGKLPLG